MAENIQLTPEEEAFYNSQAASVDPIVDLSAEDLAALAVEDKTFNIAEAFRAKPDLHKDPAFVQKSADAQNLVKQRGFSLQDLPTVPEAGHAVYTAAKGFGKQIWNYANVAGNIVAGAAAELTGQEGLAAGYAEDINKRLASNVAGTEEAMTGLSQLAEKGVKKLGRATGVSKDFSQFTPEEKVADLFADVGKAEVSQQRLEGKGAFTSAVTAGTGAETLKKEGVTPEDVGELAAGDPASFFLFGQAGKLVGGAAKVVTPAAVKAVPAIVEAAASKAAQKVGGGLVQAAGKTAEGVAKGAEVVGKVASVAGPVAGGIALATGADVASAGLGGLLGGTSGVALKRLGQLAMPAAKKITDIGRQISGAPITSAYAQAGRDILQALPGATGEFAKGLGLDIGLAAVTAELPQDTAGAVGFGATLGALGGAARIGGRVLSGQLIAPREYGVNKITPSSGQFPAFDKLHSDSIKAAPPAVKARLNAVREFVEGSAPNTDVFLATDSAGVEQALRGAGVSDATAKNWSERDGFFTVDLNGKNGQPRRVIVMKNVDVAPHESFHAIQDVLGEEANRAIDKIVRETYADRWDAEGEKYAQQFGNLGEKTWQESVLDASGWGLAEAKEKIYRDIYNRMEAETGAAPRAEVVQELATNALGRIMDESVARNEQIQPNEIAAHIWREVLSPEEAGAVADRYIAREIAAENFDAIFKNQGPRLQEGTQLPQRLAQIVGGFVTALGGEPLAGRQSELGAIPLRTPVVEAVRQAGQTRTGKPEIQPESGKIRKNPAISGTPVTPDTAAEEARAIADEAPEAPLPGGTRSPRELLGQIAESIATRQGVRINYLSAPGEPAAAATSNRTTRRAIIEAFRDMPAEARSLWEKTFFPDRVTRTSAGKYQIQGWAPEVFAANAHKLAKFLAEVPAAEALSPYLVDKATGTFTTDAWQQLFADTQTFVQNQIRGATGSGEPLVVPKSVTDAGGFAPATRPGAETLAQNKADFINLLFNFKLPETPRIQTGRRPLNVIGQEVSAATQPGRVEIPVRPRGEYTGAEAARQGIEGTAIAEVNPLRNQLEAAAQSAGKPMPSMIEAVQKLNLENIKEVEGVPEVPEFRGNTLTLSAGFAPEATQGREWRVSGQLRGVNKQITVRAADQAAARKLADAQGMRVAKVETADKMSNAMFSPSTARGREFEKQGFEFRRTGGPSNPGIVIFKDGDLVGDITATRSSPKEADIAMVHVSPAFRNQRLSEALYREMGQYLKDEGVKEVTGMIINEKALQSRAKVFPETDIESINEFSDGRSYEVRSRIPESAQFSPESVAADVQRFTPEEFSAWAAKIPGGLTAEAFRVGRAATSQEFVDGLNAAQQALQPKIKELMKAGDFDNAMAAASQGQFFREAYEAATGTASAGESLRKSDPNYKPPFPPKTETAQMAPKKAQKKDYELKPASAGFSKAWILPNGDPVQLGGKWHHEWVNENPEIAERYKLKSTTSGEENRVDALKAGFARINYAQNSGTLTVEARARDWRKLKSSVEQFVEKNLDDVDNMTVTLTDGKAEKTVDSLSAKLFNYDDVEKLQHLPFITEGEVRGQFSPKRDEDFYRTEELVRPSKENFSTFEQFEEGGIGLAPAWVLRDGKRSLGFGGEYHDDAIAGYSQLEEPFVEAGRGNTAEKFQYDTGAMRVATFSSEKQLNDFGGELGVSISREPSGAQVKYFQELLKEKRSYGSDSRPVFDKAAIDVVGKDGEVLRAKVFSMPQERGAAMRFFRDPFKEESAQFAPKAKSESELGMEIESNPRTFNRKITKQIQESKIQYPEALPLNIKKDDAGNYRRDAKGKEMPQEVGYDLFDTPLAAQAAKGKRGEDARKNAISDAYAKKIAEAYQEAAKNPAIAAGAEWYSLARTKIKKLLGDDTKFFTELLGVTSAQTDVATNFRYAVEAYNNFKSGKYDRQIQKYQEGKELWDLGDLGLEPGETPFVEVLNDLGLKPDSTRAAFLSKWIERHDLKPKKDNGSLYGANSDAVLRVLDGSWRAEVQGPKTPNFADNLSGDSFESTIDIWSARGLHRMGNEGNTKRWRILPKNETGVSDADFSLGQRAYRKAADELKISPDSLQAILWFYEKEIWDRKGWTSKAGAEKSDFNTFLDVTDWGFKESGELGKLRIDEAELERRTEAKAGKVELDLLPGFE